MRPLRPSDLYRLEHVADVALAPDDRSVVFTIAWPDEGTDENRSRLWRLDLSIEGPASLLIDGHRDTRPVFSPDGASLAFLRSAVSSTAKPAVLDLATLTPTTVDSIVDGAIDVQWRDNDRLAVLANRRPSDQEGIDDDELHRRPRVIDSLDYRFNGRNWIHDRPRNIALVDRRTGDVRWVESSSLDLGSFDCSGVAASPGIDRLAAILPDPDHEFTGATSVWLLGIDGGPAVRMTGAGGSWSAVGWTLDGRPFATGHLDAGLTSFDQPHLLDPSGIESPRRLGTDDVNCTALLGGAARPVAIEGALLLPGLRGGTITIDRYDLDTGETSVVAPVRGMTGSFTASADGGRLIGAVATPTRPAELWDCTHGAAGSTTVLVPLNEAALAELDLVEPDVVTIASHGPGLGEQTVIEAFLLHPPASAPRPAGDGRRPGLLYVHGGPQSIYGLNFFDEFQLAAAAGYVVIGANPRGSDGYGIDFARAVVGDMGGPDWIDVSAVADHLAALESVDEARIGMGGGSYGGFMTAWAVGHTDRFAAALVERCVSNWESFIGTSDIGPWFAHRYCAATIESDVEAIRRQSAISYAANNTTPTLLLHSEEDWRCPPEQSEQLFGAYRRAGVDATFVRFPGENHELTRSGKPRHRVDRFGIVHDFFARHLGGGRFDR